jgi:endonuclease/exonuclease/phosphatase family metal-dependent hydrolase
VVVELRVATFNIQHGLSAGGEVDVALLARTCRRLDVDVLAIQEVDRHLERTDRLDIAAAIAEECAMSCAFGPAIAIRGGEYGNALLVRGEIGAVDVLDLPRPSRKEARAALIADIKVSDSRVSGGSVAATPMTAVSTHLSVPTVDSEPQLAALLEALGSRADPQLVLGDLNLPPDALGPFAEAGYAIAGGGPTWPAKAPRRRIDHILVRGLDIVSVDIPETPCSDHRPLVATLRTSEA